MGTHDARWLTDRPWMVLVGFSSWVCEAYRRIKIFVVEQFWTYISTLVKGNSLLSEYQRRRGTPTKIADHSGPGFYIL